MADSLAAFLASPSGDTFVRLRAELIKTPEFDFYSQDDIELLELVNGADDSLVADKVRTMMPDWLLCPLVHRLAAKVALAVGDHKTAEREQFLAHACVRGLLQSGDGSRERPYLVTHIADEYEILNHLKKLPAEQSPVSDELGFFDRIRCKDGSVVWFDVSAGIPLG